MTTATKIDYMKKQLELDELTRKVWTLTAQRDELAQELESEILSEFTPGDSFTKSAAISGTHNQGEVTTTRAELLRVFGSPNYCEWDSYDKITIEWELTFSDGTVATIYDYKRAEYGDDEPLPLFGEYDYHIGGTSPRAVELVKQHLNS
jgi:hypothetical protein